MEISLMTINIIFFDTYISFVENNKLNLMINETKIFS